MTSHLKPLNTKMSTTYDAGNPGPGLGQAHKCGGIKPVNGISILQLLIIGFPTVIQI
jgi:hypothetical protein